MSVADLRGILTYVPRFREKIFVVAMDGSIIAHENFPNILLDLAVLRSLNIHLVLVHGAGHQVKELAQKTGVTISNHHGIGVTDEETLNVSMTAANRVTHEILEGLSSSDIRACCTNAVIAHPYGIVQGVNHQYTGRVERVDVGFLHQLLEKDIVPVIPPLGFDGDGKTYRVNSDGVAQKVAEVLKASKLIYISEYPGVSNGKKLMQLSVFEAEDYLKKKRSELPLELALKFEHCVKACQNGSVARI
jgi:amino-acid N-acetyltransferase